MQPSQSLINYLTSTEGFMPRPYLDPKGNTMGKYSTGFGHQIQPNEQYLMTKVLSRADATALLQKDLAYYVAAVNASIKRPVTQAQFDALVDFAYNDGTGAEAKVISTWNTTGDSTQTVQHLQEYVYANGAINQNLIARRQYEANLFQGFVAGVEDLAKKKAVGS